MGIRELASKQPTTQTTGKSIRTLAAQPTPVQKAPVAEEKKGFLSKIGSSLKDLWKAGTTPTESKTIFGTIGETAETYGKLKAPETRAAEIGRITELREEEKAEAEKAYLAEYKKQMAAAEKHAGIAGKTAIRAGHEFITGLTGAEPPDLSTGNKVADVISSILGQGAGFVTGAALTGAGRAGALAGTKAAAATAKATAKLGLSSKAIASKVAQAAVREGVEGTMLAGIHSAINADTKEEFVSRLKDYGLYGLALGGGGKLLGETGNALIKAINPKVKKLKVPKTKDLSEVKADLEKIKSVKAIDEKVAAIKAEKAAPKKVKVTAKTEAAKAKLKAEAAKKPKATVKKKLEAPKKEKFGEKQLEQLDNLKEKYSADKVKVEKSDLSSTDKKTKLNELESKYKADRNKVIYGAEEGIPAKTQKKLDKLKSEYEAKKAEIKGMDLAQETKKARLKEASVNYNANKKSIMQELATGEKTKLKAPEVKAPTKKKMTVAERVAKKAEIEYNRKIIKDPKSTPAQIKRAQNRIKELEALLEAGEEIFPYYDPTKMEKMIDNLDKATPEKIKDAVSRLKRTLKSDVATKYAKERSTNFLKQLESKGIKEAKIPKPKFKAPEPTGKYGGKPTVEITKKDIPKEEWRKLRNKYASEEENVKIFQANISADKIMKMKDTALAKSEADTYLKSIGSEAKITDNMTPKEIATTVTSEGVKYAKKSSIEKLLKENAEFIQKNKKPEGWSKVVSNKDGTSYYAPNKYIAEQLKPLVDDGWLQDALEKGGRIGKAFRVMQVVKEMRLSGDFFLETRATMQFLANNKFNVAKMFKKDFKLDTPEFLERELIAVKDGLITPKVFKYAGAEERVAAEIGKGKLPKLKEASVKTVKKILEVEEKRMDMFYNKMQRSFKVKDYWSKRQAWIAKNPGYTEEALKEAGRKIASEVNAVYKGLNYKVIGYSGSTRDWMRLAMLAPDYTLSKLELLKEVGKRNPAAITHILTTVIGSYAIMTQGLNVLFTGHSTFKNEEGHKLEVQIRPGVYIQTLPDWVYDLKKLVTKPVGYVVGKSGFWSQPFYTAYAKHKTGWDAFSEFLKLPIPTPFEEIENIGEAETTILEKILISAGILTRSGSTKKSKKSTAQERAAAARKRLKSP